MGQANKRVTKNLLSASGMDTFIDYKEDYYSDKEINRIPPPKEYDTTKSGASSYENRGDHEDSRYFPRIPFYNMKTDNTLTIIPHYKTYQQTTDWTCGPCAALMVLNHYGVKEWEEYEIAEIMETDNTVGTSTDRMVKFFKHIGWEVESSIDRTSSDNGHNFSSVQDFKRWVIENLKKNAPIIVESVEWGGHWQTIIGYDTLGSVTIGDDVIIFADSYDTWDHFQDGYVIAPVEKFFQMWFDDHCLPSAQKHQQWIVARPKR